MSVFSSVEAVLGVPLFQVATAAVDSGGRPATIPDDIQWMPPGKHELTPTVKGKPQTITIDVTAGLADRLVAKFRELQQAAAAGTEDEPFVDFAHRRDAAAGHVTSMYWGGEDPIKGGIRIKVTWTKAGRAALEDRQYRRFSPAWLVAEDSGQPVALGANMGGLVNHAAFTRIAPVRAAADPHQISQSTTMTPDQIQAAVGQAITGALKPITDRLDKLDAAAAKPVAQAAGTPGLSAEAGQVAELTTRLKALETAQAGSQTAHADRCVAAAVQAGRIPPQDQAAHGFWKSAILAQGPTAEAQLAALPVNPAFVQLVHNGASSGAAGAASATGEHPFLVAAAARAKADKTNLVEASAQVAGEKPELYQQYRESLRQ